MKQDEEFIPVDGYVCRICDSPAHYRESDERFWLCLKCERGSHSVSIFFKPTESRFDRITQALKWTSKSKTN